VPIDVGCSDDDEDDDDGKDNDNAVDLASDVPNGDANAEAVADDENADADADEFAALAAVPAAACEKSGVGRRRGVSADNGGAEPCALAFNADADACKGSETRARCGTFAGADAETNEDGDGAKDDEDGADDGVPIVAGEAAEDEKGTCALGQLEVRPERGVCISIGTCVRVCVYVCVCIRIRVCDCVGVGGSGAIESSCCAARRSVSA
jgi:hypothetical protein